MKGLKLLSAQIFEGVRCQTEFDVPSNFNVQMCTSSVAHFMNIAVAGCNLFDFVSRKCLVILCHRLIFSQATHY